MIIPSQLKQERFDNLMIRVAVRLSNSQSSDRLRGLGYLVGVGDFGLESGTMGWSRGLRVERRLGNGK